MTTRSPAVAGSFYEAKPDRLSAQVEACFAANERPAAKRRFIGAVVPHAGLMYSGHVAAAFYALAELPKRLIILCPNHTGFGHPAAISIAVVGMKPHIETSKSCTTSQSARGSSASTASIASWSLRSVSF